MEQSPTLGHAGSMKNPDPICTFDVADAATPAPLDLSVPDGVTYRWLHFDLNDEGFAPWAQANLPDVVASALLAPATRPRCQTIETGLLLNLRGVNLNPGADADDMVSLRLWVTENLIVSARLRKIFAIDDIRKSMDRDPPKTPGEFLHHLSENLTRRISEASIALDEKTDELDETVELGTLQPKSLLDLMQFIHRLHRYVRPQRDALLHLARVDLPWLRQAQLNISETANQTLRISEELDSAHNRLRSIRDHLDAVQTAKMGRNSYVLSIVAAIFLPLGFLTGLFGVNVAGMPGTTWAPAFWVLTLGTIVLGGGVAAILRWAKWL